MNERFDEGNDAAAVVAVTVVDVADNVNFDAVGLLWFGALFVLDLARGFALVI